MQPTDWSTLKQNQELYELFLKVICAEKPEGEVWQYNYIPDIRETIRKAVEQVKPYFESEVLGQIKIDREIYRPVDEAVTVLREKYRHLKEFHDELDSRLEERKKKLNDKLAKLSKRRKKTEELTREITSLNAEIEELKKLEEQKEEFRTQLENFTASIMGIASLRIKERNDFIQASTNILAGACWDFVDYQFNTWNMCRGNREVFTREGFQIGSP